MRKFVKGKLETVVEDNDRRIPDYLANGWTETTPKAPKSEGEQSATDKALQDVANSENGGNEPPKGKGKGKGGKAGKPGTPNETDQKVNDAINANSNAAAESGAVDDGLEPNSSSETNETKGGE